MYRMALRLEGPTLLKWVKTLVEEQKPKEPVDAELLNCVRALKCVLSTEWESMNASSDAIKNRVIESQKRMNDIEREIQEFRRVEYERPCIRAIVQEFQNMESAVIVNLVKEQMALLEKYGRPVPSFNHGLGAMDDPFYERTFAQPLQEKLSNAQRELEEAQTYERYAQLLREVKEMFESSFAPRFEQLAMIPASQPTHSLPSQHSEAELCASVPIHTSPDRTLSLNTAPTSPNLNLGKKGRGSPRKVAEEPAQGELYEAKKRKKRTRDVTPDLELAREPSKRNQRVQKRAATRGKHYRDESDVVSERDSVSSNGSEDEGTRKDHMQEFTYSSLIAEVGEGRGTSQQLPIPSTQASAN
jgi:hypothetical protein